MTDADLVAKVREAAERLLRDEECPCVGGPGRETDLGCKFCHGTGSADSAETFCARAALALVDECEMHRTLRLRLPMHLRDEMYEWIARAEEAERLVDAARRRLDCVAEGMTEHTYQELASTLEAPPRDR